MDSGGSVRQDDNTARGIAIMVAAQAIFAITDALQKLVMETTPLMTVVWSRFAVFMILLAPVMLRTPAHLQRSSERRILVLRACMLLGATLFMAAALKRLPLATAIALMFVGPFIVTALSVPMLGEHVGWRRWIAIAVGFGGMLIVVRPGMAGIDFAALFVLGSTICWSFGVIVTRRVGGRIEAMTILVWQAIVGFIITTPLAYVDWTPIGGRDTALLVLNGVLNLIAQFMTVRALQMAPASAVAPVSYTLIVWATLLGWLFFSTLPDRWTLAGAAVIIASGLYVWWRERVRAAARTTGNP